MNYTTLLLLFLASTANQEKKKDKKHANKRQPIDLTLSAEILELIHASASYDHRISTKNERRMVCARCTRYSKGTPMPYSKLWA
jgi:hypothetical protein